MIERKKNKSNLTPSKIGCDQGERLLHRIQVSEDAEIDEYVWSTRAEDKIRE